jgi:DNA-binding GntR family transcriptional regulator
MPQEKRRMPAARDPTGTTARAVPPPGDRHTSLRDMVVAEIREAILSGRYRPGERLAELRLARDFNVSRNPVREALRSLEAEGLIRFAPRRGATVTVPSLDDARAMVEVRAMLEGVNARLAARLRDPEMIAALRQVLKEGSAAAKIGNVGDLVRLNSRFHELLAAAGRNRFLADLTRSLRDRTSIAFGPMSAKHAKRTWDEHAQILEAVIAGDEELSSVLASRHTLRLGTEHLSQLSASFASSGE